MFGSDGKRYIDLGSGIAVNIFGHCDPVWTAAVEKQLHTFAHTSNYYYSAPQADLAERLCTRTGMARVFFSNSGAEANECAIKTARKYAFDKYGKGRSTIVTLTGSFHGRTMATLAATGQDAFHNYFFPFPEGFAYTPGKRCRSVESCAGRLRFARSCSKCVQGEGGVERARAGFRDRLPLRSAPSGTSSCSSTRCRPASGEPARSYAYEQFGKSSRTYLQLAKGLGGGLPDRRDACWAEKRAGTPTPSGTTARPSAATRSARRARLSVIDRIDDRAAWQVCAARALISGKSWKSTPTSGRFPEWD